MTDEPGEAKPAVTSSTDADHGHRDVLAYAVSGIGGAERPGQVAMRTRLSAFASGRHLLGRPHRHGQVLGYLPPGAGAEASSRGSGCGGHATLALQSQLANADIPAALDAVEAVVGERPRHAILKGRTNYACLLKVRDSATQDQGTLISADDLAETIKAAPLASPESVLGAEVLALREGRREAGFGGWPTRDAP